ncbi:unnamed protein product [Owenia fusiformis]|uniref:PABC domain-containing protein n=1 Tax=Owenia fusiformis TaxID=6347 RepID=A0A8S4NXB1_OWEFU|nr:unnamed protein product [Owenia fusiformis]
MALLTTHEVLGEHLYAKVAVLTEDKDSQKITGILMECTDDDILKMLKDEELLKRRIEKVLQHIQIERCKPLEKDQEELGERLFPLVAEIESELCAQITGMLLELDRPSIELLLNSESDLENAIQKAKTEYLKQLGYEQDTGTPQEEDVTIQELGEAVFDRVSEKYPKMEDASQITGMLLDLGTKTLQELLQNKQEFMAKVDQAYKILDHSKS